MGLPLTENNFGVISNDSEIIAICKEENVWKNVAPGCEVKYLSKNEAYVQIAIMKAAYSHISSDNEFLTQYPVMCYVLLDFDNMIAKQFPDLESAKQYKPLPDYAVAMMLKEMAEHYKSSENPVPWNHHCRIKLDLEWCNCCHQYHERSEAPEVVETPEADITENDQKGKEIEPPELADDEPPELADDEPPELVDDEPPVKLQIITKETTTVDPESFNIIVKKLKSSASLEPEENIFKPGVDDRNYERFRNLEMRQWYGACDNTSSLSSVVDSHFTFFYSMGDIDTESDDYDELAVKEIIEKHVRSMYTIVRGQKREYVCGWSLR